MPSSEVPALQKQAGSSPCTGTSQPQRPRSRGRHSNASPDVRGPRFVQRELQSEPSQCRRAEQAGRQPTLGWHVGPQGGWEVESRRGWGAKAECVILDVGWEQGRCEREGQRPGPCLLAPRVAPLEGGSAEAGRPTGGHRTAHKDSAVTAEVWEGFRSEPLLLISLSFQSTPVPSPGSLCQMGEMKPPDRMSGDSRSPVWHETGCQREPAAHCLLC